MRTMAMSTVLLALVMLRSPGPAQANPRGPGPRAPAGRSGMKQRAPSGTFRNASGQVTLKYLGEGTVAVTLKTKYCTLEVKDGGTFVFPQGVHVMNKKNEPVLVLFYQPRSVVVYGELPAFKQAHCKGGQDATGLFKRGK